MKTKLIFCNVNDEIEENVAVYKHFTDVIAIGEKIPKQGIAFISFDNIGIQCIMTFNKSGNVVTKKQRISFKNPIEIDNSIKLNEVTNYLSANLKRHFERQTKNHITALSEKVSMGLLDFFKKNHSDIYEKIKELKARIKITIPNYGLKEKEIIVQEKDAVHLVFKMFDFKESDLPVWNPISNSAPFLIGYNLTTIREDPMVNHDSQVFGDWSKVAPNLQGAVEFEKENQRITLMNVNRQPLEKTLGVDLLIYHHTYQSYIFIQYKRMTKETDIYLYRPIDSPYKSEIKRMKKFMKSLYLKSDSSIENYRLNNELFYFKLCKAKIENLYTNRMFSGMYIPLKLWDTLLKDKSTDGIKGGKQFSYHNVGRYFNNTQFVNLAQNGWIGSQIVNADKITKIIKSSINSDNSLTLAKCELIEKK